MKSLGVVKWFNDAKGYGIIVLDGENVFAHYSDITGAGFKTLMPGQEVEFDLVDHPKGKQAKGIIKTGGVDPRFLVPEEADHD